MTPIDPVFANTLALAGLPYFRRENDHTLALADPSLGPAIDVHTHLALSYGPVGDLDLWRRHPETEHYLSVRRRIDLDVYANRNFSPADLARLRRDLTLGSFTRGGLRRTHTAANLLADMAPLGIAASVLLPIDFPVLSRNAETYLAVAAGSAGRLLGFGSVHPFASRPEQRLAEQKAAGALGIKVHPAVQAVAPDHPRALRLYRACGALGLLVLWHCGPVGIEPWLGRRLSQVKHYWRAVHEHPDTRFILGHAGALQWPLALELAQRYPNVYLEVASQSLAVVERLVAEAPAERLLFGTDWPFYPQAFGLAKVYLATEGKPEARRRILWENAVRLLGCEPPRPATAHAVAAGTS